MSLKQQQFQEWKAENLSYYNGLQRALLERIRNKYHVEVNVYVIRTGFSAKFRIRFYNEVWLQRKAEIDENYFMKMAEEIM